MEWPSVESRVISYSINDGVLEASITCQQGYQLQHHLNTSSRRMLPDQHHQLQRLIARCHGNVWDTKPPHCFGRMSLFTVDIRTLEKFKKLKTSKN